MKRFQLVSMITQGAFRGSFLANEIKSGRRFRLRVYPVLRQHRRLVESVMTELEWHNTAEDVVFQSAEWLVIASPYEAWWPIREVFSRQKKFQSSAATALVIAHLGSQVADKYENGKEIPPIYPDNIIVSSSGEIRFWHYLSPVKALPTAYRRYMAPEELVMGERGPQSFAFNLGAILYEMVEGRPLSRHKVEDPLAHWLKIRPFGRWFKDQVGSPHAWLARSPELRGQDLRALCSELLQRTRPHHLQSLIKIADEPEESIEPAHLSWAWLEQHRPAIVASLQREVHELNDVTQQAIPIETSAHWRLLHRLDAAAAAQVHGIQGAPTAIKHHVEYQELTADTLIKYLQAWQDLADAYRVIAGLKKVRLKILSFNTGNSFTSFSTVDLDEADHTAQVDATAGTLALHDVVTEFSTEHLSRTQQRAVTKAKKAVESVHQTLPSEHVSLDAEHHNRGAGR